MLYEPTTIFTIALKGADASKPDGRFITVAADRYSELPSLPLGATVAVSGRDRLTRDRPEFVLPIDTQALVVRLRRWGEVPLRKYVLLLKEECTYRVEVEAHSQQEATKLAIDKFSPTVSQRVGCDLSVDACSVRDL